MQVLRITVSGQRTTKSSPKVLDKPVAGGWSADAQRLTNRIKRHWDEWFTFLSYPEVKPDNNDAERALRPIVVHRKGLWRSQK